MPTTECLNFFYLSGEKKKHHNHKFSKNINIIINYLIEIKRS